MWRRSQVEVFPRRRGGSCVGVGEGRGGCRPFVKAVLMRGAGQPILRRTLLRPPMMETLQLASAPFRSPLHANNTQRHTTAPSQPRVLVVDDEEAIRTAIARFLRTQGYEVEVVESGPAALAIPKRQP